MAERRMLAKKIVESDSFLDLPISAQLLYFHANMHADDDGFLNNVKTIQRMIGASEADLSVLIEKRFLLSFPSGVVVVKHWKMNNTIKADRYRKTQYQEELTRLRVKKNKAYTDNLNHPDIEISRESSEPCGSSLDPQERIIQNNLNYYNLDEERKTDKLYFQSNRIVDQYNRTCASFPGVMILSNDRVQAIGACLEVFSEDDIAKAFEIAESSTFLKNHGGNWKTDFDWLIKVEHIEKILNGKYTDKAEQSIQRQLDDDEKRAIRDMMNAD